MRRIFLIGLGVCCLVLAGVGVVLPGLPTTPFLIVAAACFAKSSPRLHNWLLSNRVFAPILKNWEESRSIPRKAKRLSLVMIGFVGISSVMLLENLYLKLLIPALLVFPIIFISRLKETESFLASQEDS